MKKTVIISGEADGVDTIAKQIAKENNFNYKPYDPYNADETYTEYSYNQYLNKLFYLRNEEMAEKGDVLIAIWDVSNGTKNMIDIMLKKQKQTRVFIYN